VQGGRHAADDHNHDYYDYHSTYHRLNNANDHTYYYNNGRANNRSADGARYALM